MGDSIYFLIDVYGNATTTSNLIYLSILILLGIDDISFWESSQSRSEKNYITPQNTSKTSQFHEVHIHKSKLGARIHSSEVRATDLGSEVSAKIYGSDLGAEICGSEVPATSVLPRMLYCA